MLTATAAIVAYFRIFSGFAEWDDEGTLMATVHQYLTGSKLYEEIFSGYGPVYYFYSGLVRAATGNVLDHNSVRLTSAVVSLLLPVLGAWIVLRLTRSLPVASVVHLLIFRSLWYFTNEPGHPQELCLLLVVLLGAIGIPAESPRRRWMALAVSGSIAAALTLVKVNVGIFAILTVALAVLFQAPSGWLYRVARYAAAAAALILPFALMRVHLNDPPAQAYCFVVTAGMAGVLFAAGAFSRDAAFSLRECLAAVAGFAVTFVLALVVLAGQGVSMQATFNSLVMNQVRMNVSPGFWYGAVALNRIWILWAVAGLGGAVLVARPQPDTHRMLSRFQIGFGVIGLAMAAAVPQLLLGFVTPFCWLLLYPPTDRASRHAHGRILIAVLAVLQTLNAYPMAGSQAAFLRLLLMLIAAVALLDGLQGWRLSSSRAPAFQQFGRLVAAVILAATLLAYPILAYRAERLYESLAPLNLPGAERIHVDKDVAQDFQWLAANLKQNCDTFVGLPGLPSFYFWTGEPLPGPVHQVAGQLNWDQWMDLFTPAQQEVIARDFALHPKACAVYHPSGVEFWNTGNHEIRSWPLANYILTNFKTIAQSGDYQFMIRNERSLSIPPGVQRAAPLPRKR